jgi:hypothetical protein
MSIALDLYWSHDRGDNFTTATPQGKRDAVDAGYTFIRNEGYVFPSSQPNTVPLELYYSSPRGDNFTTATAEGKRAALNAGYTFVRTEGYVYPVQQPNTVPLELYYSSPRGDNFTTATAEGKRAALNAGYTFVRNEGFVSASPQSIDIELDSDLGANHFMTTRGVLLANGHIDAMTRTRTLTMFGGFVGGVQMILEDANGYTIGATKTHTFGVDGTVTGRSDRSEYWTEELDSALASRVAAIHVQHFWAPRYDSFRRVVDEAIAVGKPLIELIGAIKALGGDAK